MKKFVPLNDLFDKLKGKGLNTWLDKLTFLRIFLIWTSIIILFGIFYFFLSNNHSYLSYLPQNNTISRLSDSIYFSFITATSTGYGDIIPLGYFKIITIFEVIFGLLLLAFVTSKLISIKQDIILSEIYDISFNEKINRLRSSLLVFRQNLNRVINKIEENSIRKREINDLYIQFSSLEDILTEILSLFDISSEKQFKKVIDPVHTELLFNSILNSFEKTSELIMILNQSRPDWRREITINLINHCLSMNDTLFSRLNTQKNVSEKTIADLNSQKNKIIDLIKSGLEFIPEKKE
ncbi:MAG: potassium channel family protein [Nanoarchaeota archaeon]|nr:potassium channel family protein [Nanoarchaeota archaeon]MBU1005514.1 potassium channel family protein [Nanoarchaeota archaeon]MBU1945853.1 potassium channel family protein [Nanoarchaeota archaeon]